MPCINSPLLLYSASEITTKLCDEEFARKAKAADFYPKTWDIFLRAGAGRGEDKVNQYLYTITPANLLYLPGS
jgi:hypothetical protein